MTKKKIDDLVDFIDSFMASGGSHVNVVSDPDLNETIVDISKDNECCNGPCKLPTLDMEDK